MAGIEDVVNIRGHYRFREWFEHVNAKILKPLLMCDVKRTDYDASEIIRFGSPFSLTT
jgi:hypothetical protein